MKIIDDSSNPFGIFTFPTPRHVGSKTEENRDCPARPVYRRTCRRPNQPFLCGLSPNWRGLDVIPRARTWAHCITVFTYVCIALYVPWCMIRTSTPTVRYVRMNKVGFKSRKNMRWKILFVSRWRISYCIPVGGRNGSNEGRDHDMHDTRGGTLRKKHERILSNLNLVKSLHCRSFIEQKFSPCWAWKGCKEEQKHTPHVILPPDHLRHLWVGLDRPFFGLLTTCTQKWTHTILIETLFCKCLISELS